MKFNLARLMAAAAIGTTLSGQALAAPITTVAGELAFLNGAPLLLEAGSQAAVSYSNGDWFDSQHPYYSVGGLIGLLNKGQVLVRDINGVSLEQIFMTDDDLPPGDVVRTRIAVGLAVDGHTIDDTTGQILSVGTTGGIRHTGTRVSGTLTGGVATVSNLRFDLANQLVYADLAGTRAALGTRPSATYNLPNTALWTIGSVSGPDTIDPAALALTGQARIDALVADGFTDEGNNRFGARTVLSNLRITPTGLDFFKNSLGLLSLSLVALSEVDAETQGWGSVTLDLSFNAPAVPEPGSYALAGVGVLMVLGARRARRSNGKP